MASRKKQGAPEHARGSCARRSKARLGLVVARVVAALRAELALLRVVGRRALGLLLLVGLPMRLLRKRRSSEQRNAQRGQNKLCGDRLHNCTSFVVSTAPRREPIDDIALHKCWKGHYRVTKMLWNSMH